MTKKRDKSGEDWFPRKSFLPGRGWSFGRLRSRKGKEKEPYWHGDGDLPAEYVMDEAEAESDQQMGQAANDAFGTASCSADGRSGMESPDPLVIPTSLGV